MKAAKFKKRLKLIAKARASRFSPSRVDPTHTASLRRSFAAEMKKRFQRLRLKVLDTIVKDDALGLVGTGVFNAFCPTGEGGGVDPSCSPGSSGSGASELTKIDKVINDPAVLKWLKIPKKMYHITDRSRLSSIQKEGLKLGSKRTTSTGKIRGVYLTKSTDINDLGKEGGDFDIKDPVTLEITTKGLDLRLDPEYFYYDNQTTAGAKEYVKAVNDGEEGFALYSPKSIPKSNIKIVRNVFCPTGEGGGIDPSCSPGGGGGGGKGGEGKGSGKAAKSQAKVKPNVYAYVQGQFGAVDVGIVEKDIRDNEALAADADLKAEAYREGGNEFEQKGWEDAAKRYRGIAASARQSMERQKVDFNKAVETFAGGNVGRFADLVGAPDNADINVTAGIDGTSISIKVDSPDYFASRYVKLDESGAKVMTNDSFFMKGGTGSGLGSKILDDQVAALREEGFARIETWAAKGPGMNGYYTWPRLGYDQKVSDLQYKARDRIQKLFPEAKTIQDVMATQEGRDWWKENGTNLRKATFDLTEGSRSLAVHEAYMKERAEKAAAKGASTKTTNVGKDTGIEDEDDAPPPPDKLNEIQLEPWEEEALDEALRKFEKAGTLNVDYEDEQWLVNNVFCPTGTGGGVDPSCSPGGATGGGSSAVGSRKEAKAALKSNPKASSKLLYKQSVKAYDAARESGKSHSASLRAAEATLPTDVPCCLYDPTPSIDNARVGVPANEVPPPGEIGRLPNLNERQREVETRFAEAYMKDPDGMARQYREALASRKVGEYDNVFATDDVKALNPDWNPAGIEDKLDSKNLPANVKSAMAENNTAVHQTANAITKRAFVQHLDEVVSKYPEGDPRRSVLVTNGGCAAGKGSTLAGTTDPDNPHYGMLPDPAKTGAIWDAAGEQNATENAWVAKECEARGIKATFAYVWANPEDTWDADDRGVIRRAMKKGRMVDARLFADSYAEGAKNMDAFVQSSQGKPGRDFIFIDNREKSEPRVLDSFPKKTLKWDSEKIYRNAIEGLKDRKKDLSPELVNAGLAGRQIWGPPKSKGRTDNAYIVINIGSNDLEDELDSRFQDRLLSIQSSDMFGIGKPLGDSLTAGLDYVIFEEDLDSPDDDEPIDNEFNPDQPRGEDGKWSAVGGGSGASEGGSESGGIMGRLKAMGAAIGHAEYVAKEYVKDKIAAAVSKLPSPIRVVVEKTYAVGKGALKVAFGTWIAGQALAERVAVERGMTEEQARTFRGALAASDLIAMKPAAMGMAASGLGPLGVIGASFIPPATATYLAYSTARNPIKTARAAKSMIKGVARGTIGTIMNPSAAAFGKEGGFATNADAQTEAIADSLAAHNFDDWYLALLLTALDETGDIAEAIRLASAAYKEVPTENENPLEFLVNAENWRFMSSPEKVKAFQTWLKTQIKSEVLKSDEDALWRKYAEQGFKKGAGRAFDDTRRPLKLKAETADKLGFYDGSKAEFLRSSFGRPVAVEKVKLLAGRVYTDLEGVTDTMATKMTRDLTDGLVQGKSPREIGKNLSKDIEGIGIARATTIARTEIIRAHAEGQLQALEDLGVEEVGVAVEWSTTGDEKVCEQCRPLEGIVLKLEEARGMLPRHPNCRCAWIPANVGEDAEPQKVSRTEIREAIEESLAAGGGDDFEDEEDIDEEEDVWGPGAPIARSRPESLFNYDATLNLVSRIVQSGEVKDVERKR